MGSQQLLLILLGIIIVSIAIFVGFSISAKHAILSNRDAIITDMVEIASSAHQYRVRPTSRAGGGGSYLGFRILLAKQSNENASYVLLSVDPDQISFLANSAQGFGTVSGAFDADGILVGSYSFTGKFE